MFLQSTAHFPLEGQHLFDGDQHFFCHMQEKTWLHVDYIL